MIKSLYFSQIRHLSNFHIKYQKQLGTSLNTNIAKNINVNALFIGVKII